MSKTTPQKVRPALEALAEKSLMPVTPETPKGKMKELDEATARKILAQAGGDKDKAREIARKLGYKF